MIPRLGALGTMLALTSCQSFTYVGGTANYPVNSDWTNYEYAVNVEIDGQRGKAFVDFTPKDVDVILEDRAGQVLMEKKRTVEAADLDWMARWPTPDRVEVAFFDFGESGEKKPRFVLAMTFARDEASGKFKEVEAGANAMNWVEANYAEYLERKNAYEGIFLYTASDAQTQAQVLAAAQQAADRLGLRSRSAPAFDGLIGDYVTDDFEINILREDGEKQIVISIEGFGKGDLCEKAEEMFQGLPLRGTGRSVTIIPPGGLKGQEAVLEAVGSVAAKFGLEKQPPSALGEHAGELAAYTAPGLDITVSATTLDDEYPPHLEVDLDVRGKFERAKKIEDALREALQAEVKPGLPPGKFPHNYF